VDECKPLLHGGGDVSDADDDVDNDDDDDDEFVAWRCRLTLSNPR
jgi:hypothetical protein